MDWQIMVFIVCLLLILVTTGLKETGKWLFKMAGLMLAFWVFLLLFGDAIKQMGLALQIAAGILIAVGILYIFVTWHDPPNY